MVKKSCPVCQSKNTNRNEYGFECLRCGFNNNKEYINEKIAKKEIIVEFKKPVKKPKKEKRKKPENSVRKIMREADNGINDYENFYFDSGGDDVKEMKNLLKRLVTKLRRISDFADEAEDEKIK